LKELFPYVFLEHSNCLITYQANDVSKLFLGRFLQVLLTVFTSARIGGENLSGLAMLI